jgi:hypothetical protein
MRTPAISLTLALCAAPVGYAAPPDVPRNADISINGVFLNDLESQKKILGSTIPFDTEAPLPKASFASADGTQILTVFTHPGSVGDIAEVRVAYGKRTSLKISKLGVQTFSTGKGIELGLSEAKVTSILGTPLRSSTKGVFRTIEYRIEDRPKASAFLTHYGMPIYYGVYTFKNDQLVAFQYGFEYP